MSELKNYKILTDGHYSFADPVIGQIVKGHISIVNKSIIMVTAEELIKAGSDPEKIGNLVEYAFWLREEIEEAKQ